nr:TonB-dependent receptor [uncultured Desulfobacter sp.]
MNKLKSISLSIAISLLLGNLLYAQDTQILDLDSVTVTANKMEENIKEIPQSITVMTDVEIEERGIKDVSDLIKYIPNLISTSVINFRGLNSSMFTNASPMVIYVDGVPYSHRWGFNKTISNILRVEVLRGPQGTIYGKDSMGGVINIVTKEPSNTVAGSVSAEYGTDNYGEIAFDISAPVIDNKLFFGLNGVYSQSDGYATNHYPGQREDANEKENYLSNIKLKYNPTEDLSIKFNASKESDTKYGEEGGIVPFGSDINSYERDDFKDVSYDEDTYSENKSDAQALHIDYDFKDLRFSSLTTHKKTEIDQYYDYDHSDNSPYDSLSYFMEMESKNIAQEFRLSNNNDGLRWVTGLYYENQKDDILVATRLSDTYTDAISEIKSDTLAAFGQVVIPFLEDYELTLGGRYQRITKDIDSKNYCLPAGTTGAPRYTLDEDNTWDTFLPKIALSYKIHKDLSSYFSITKGYLAGGYNYAASSGTVDQNKFDAQESINYELGIRGDLLDNRLYLSAAIFYLDIEDLHVYSHDDATGVTHTSNAAEAYSQGIELELGYTINENWRIDGSFGLIEAKYNEYTNASGTDLKDNKIQRTPSHTANLGVSYSNDHGIYGRLDIKNQGKMYFNDTNTYQENSYTTADVKIGYLFDGWDIYAYANNITDESYLTAADNMMTGTVLTYGEGRFLGIGAKYHF